MQKKKDDILGLELLVLITFNAVNTPKNKPPLSPINNFDLGKLNSKNIKSIII